MRALLIPLLAGCATTPAAIPETGASKIDGSEGVHPKSTTRSNVPAARDVPAARFTPAEQYAGLFDARRVWRYRVERVVSAYDGDQQRSFEHVETLSATCTASTAKRETAEATMALQCDGALENDQVREAVPVCGPFVATSWRADESGLWRVSPGSDCVPGQGPGGELFLAAAPSPGTTRHENEGEGSGDASVVERRDDAWCVTHSSWDGDESSDTFCFSREGIVAGRREFAGGEVRQIRFCIDERWCRDLPN